MLTHHVARLCRESLSLLVPAARTAPPLCKQPSLQCAVLPCPICAQSIYIYIYIYIVPTHHVARLCRESLSLLRRKVGPWRHDRAHAEHIVHLVDRAAALRVCACARVCVLQCC
jgi:hypothetical protein